MALSTKNRRRGLRFFTPSHVGFHFGLERRQWLCTTHWHAGLQLVSSRKPCNLLGSVLPVKRRRVGTVESSTDSSGDLKKPNGDKKSVEWRSEQSELLARTTFKRQKNSASYFLKVRSVHLLIYWKSFWGDLLLTASCDTVCDWQRKVQLHRLMWLSFELFFFFCQFLLETF